MKRYFCEDCEKQTGSDWSEPIHTERRKPVKTRRSLFLALSLAVALGAVANVPVHAVPPPCAETCDYSSTCDTACDWWNYTCGDYGVCETNIGCNGSSGPDTFNGTSAIDIYCGGGGDDTISGAAGPDALYGDDGDDTLDGGSGNDIVDGGAGADYVDGGSGSDSCTTGETYANCSP
jgi:hypothetical protein